MADGQRPSWRGSKRRRHADQDIKLSLNRLVGAQQKRLRHRKVERLRIDGTWYVAAKSRMRLRLTCVSASDTTKIASGRARIIVERAPSMSSGPRTPKGSTVMCKTPAALSTSP